MKHIRTKLMLFICLLSSIPLLALGLVSIDLNRSTTNETLEQTMTAAADQAANRVGNRLNIYKTVATETGKMARLSDPDATPESRQEIIDEKVTSYDFIQGAVAGLDGVSKLSGINHTGKDYFEAAMAGETFISEPYEDAESGMVIVMSAPIWQGGVVNTTIAGMVIYKIDARLLTDIVSTIKVSEGAAAQMIDKNGNIVAHTDYSRVENKHNSIQLAKQEPSLAKIAELESMQIKGETGFGEYEMDGVQKLLAYAPVPNTNGWSLGVNAPVDDFMEGYHTSIQLTIGILVACILLALIVSFIIAKSVSAPISACANRLQLLAEGNLSEPVPQTKAKDETGILLRSLDTCVTNLKGMINDISFHLHEMSDGNLTTHVTLHYVGDFQDIKVSLEMIIETFRKLLGEVISAADQVSAASRQVAGASQMLAQSSTEESQNMELLGKSLQEISALTEETARLVVDATDLGEQMQKKAGETSVKMEDMIQAVNDIRQAGESIDRVIKAIEDIAFQTNILSLNAAVEAARAGVHGKGFAVVAEEVGDLASKSADAAKTTTSLINDSIEKSEKGFEISQSTSEYIAEIVSGIRTTAETLSTISEGAVSQTREIASINTAIDEQIKVVHQNSATSEETAAASEQMSAQAGQLLELVSHFRIYENEPIADVDDTEAMASQ